MSCPLPGQSEQSESCKFLGGSCFIAGIYNRNISIECSGNCWLNIPPLKLRRIKHQVNAESISR